MASAIRAYAVRVVMRDRRFEICSQPGAENDKKKETEKKISCAPDCSSICIELLSAPAAATTSRNRGASFGQFSVSVGAFGARNRFSGIDCASTRSRMRRPRVLVAAVVQINGVLRRDYRKCPCAWDRPNLDDGSRLDPLDELD